MAHASKIIMDYSILYTVLRGETGHSLQKANQAMLHKRDTAYLTCVTDTVALGLISTALSRKELGSRDLELHLPQDSGPRPLLALSSMFMLLDKELCSFSTHQGLRESLGLPWLPADDLLAHLRILNSLFFPSCSHTQIFQYTCCSSQIVINIIPFSMLHRVAFLKFTIIVQIHHA